MAEEQDKGFFDKLGEIFNAPLPGTQRPTSQPQAPADDDDEGPVDDDDTSDDDGLAIFQQQFGLGGVSRKRRGVINR